MMRAQKNALWIGVCMIALAAPVARAQQSQQSKQQTPQQPADQSSGPIPAYRSPLASAADNGDNDDESQELAPDTHALSGAQNLSLGISTARSYWQPHFDFSEVADSNAQETANSAGWGTWTSLSGGVDVHQTSRSNDLSMSYTSGGMLAHNLGVASGVVQELHFTDKFTFHRSSLSLFDELNYLPESALGFGGLAVPALPGGISPGLGSSFTPGQSLLLTGFGQNLGNAFATELDTFLTPRTSLTFVGGYSLLHFFDSDLLDFSGFNFRGGYNYQMTRKDSIAVLYTFNGIRYSNFNQFINEHTVQVSYGRRVTGRLAFQVAAGPQVATSRIPISGNAVSGAGTGTGTNFTEVYWSLSTALGWRAERTSLGLTYDHGATGGSGVLAGAITDVVTGGASRQVSRTFSNSIFGGYARNEGVALSSSQPLSHTYDYLFAGAGFSHPFGRATALKFSYEMQYQTSNSALCIGTTCGTNVIRHMITMGVSWNERPLLF